MECETHVSQNRSRLITTVNRDVILRTKRTGDFGQRGVLGTDDNSVRAACLSLVSMPFSGSQFLNPEMPPMLSPLCGPNAELPILDLGRCDTSRKQARASIVCVETWTAGSRT